MAQDTISDLTQVTTLNDTDQIPARRPGDTLGIRDKYIEKSDFTTQLISNVLSNYRIPIASKNISAGNQDNDISGYEAAAYDGKIIEIGATGGTGSFTCTLTTGTYTVGEIASSQWNWIGTGRLRLLVDVANTNFIPLGPYIWDRSAGGFSNGEFKKYTDGIIEQFYRMGGTTDTTRTWTFPVASIDTNHTVDTTGAASGANYFVPNFSSIGTTSQDGRWSSAPGSTSNYISWFFRNKWTSSADSIVIG